ncbi:glycosyltransferase family 2 protein [Methylacidiphilum caldifontis]|uniref:glycosyltransferase family 2 protein n=1 Tax=Methylacidiphilum caldifontis TaxID=2795386 RepID=UPI001A8E5493|nr:glycosyltransferase family 2 protein [Methylacidiphilum caldifontis]QSR88580.1 glycosyltransferase family 2 protein [Methylacidiphilum caldifontis]
MKVSVILLTYNSEQYLEKAITNLYQISDDINAVDSFSSDDTIKILKSYNIHFIQHEFVTYSQQRNWAIKNIATKYNWQFHIDSGEFLSDDLIESISSLSEENLSGIHGIMIQRLVIFLNKKIIHGGMTPIWHLRLFRSGYGRCEEKKYDQHFIVEGKTIKIKGYIIDNVCTSLSEFIIRHNRWSDLEADDILSEPRNKNNKKDVIKGKLFGNKIERKRWWKEKYNSLPLFIRPYLLFFYRYIIKLGILDGIEGLIFFTLQTFWFRFLIDSKIYERRQLIKQK